MANRVTYNSYAMGLDPIHQEDPNGRREGGFLLRTHFTPEIDTNTRLIIIQPGLIVSELTGGIPSNVMTIAQTYFVPTTPGELYGTGTNVPYGIVRTQIDLSTFDQTITPVFKGWAHEAECYIAGGAKGDIPAAIKASLTSSGINWRR